MLLAALGGAPRIDPVRFRNDVDELIDQDPRPRPEPRRTRGLVDTAILIDPPPEAAMPEEASVAAITLADGSQASTLRAIQMSGQPHTTSPGDLGTPSRPSPASTLREPRTHCSFKAHWRPIQAMRWWEVAVDAASDCRWYSIQRHDLPNGCVVRVGFVAGPQRGESVGLC